MRIFRVSFFRCIKLGKRVGIGFSIFIFITSVLTWIFNLKTFQDFLNGLLISFSSAIIVGIICAILIPLIVYSINLFYPVKVDLNGIRASKYSGIKATLKHQELTTASTSSLYGVPYLVLEDVTGISIWIPELLKNQHDFYLELVKHTKHENPDFHAFFIAFRDARQGPT